MKRLYYGLGKRKFAEWILLAVFVLFFYGPLFNMLTLSFAGKYEYPDVIPQTYGLKWWDYILSKGQMLESITTSLLLAVVVTVISLLICLPAAYAIARYKMGKMNTAILTARLLPNISILLPYYFIFSKLKMIDTYGVLILSHMVLSLPLIVWIMTGFFADLPLELEEAAIVDGCTRQKCFTNVLLPISTPGLVTCATLSFLGSWNNFQFALILSGEKTRTLPVSLQYFVSGADIRWGRMLAATIVVIVPTIILTMILQKYIVQGMTAGAVKG